MTFGYLFILRTSAVNDDDDEELPYSELVIWLKPPAWIYSMFEGRSVFTSL